MPPRVVVAAVVEQEGRILVAQRTAEKHYPLQWEFPGGKVEPGETPEAALRREIREEFAVDIEVLDLLERVHHDYGAGHDYELLFYACRILHGTPVAQPHQGVHAFRWVARVELPGLDFLEGNRGFARRLAAHAR